jgi:hypothetical protein
MMQLKFTAYVYPKDTPTSPLVSEPKKLNLDTGDDEKEHRISFKNITMDTVQLELVWNDERFLDVQVPDTRIGPGERTEVIVKVNKDRHTPRFEKSFTIQISDKDKTRMTVPVTFGRGTGPTDKVKIK